MITNFCILQNRIWLPNKIEKHLIPLYPERGYEVSNETYPVSYKPKAMAIYRPTGMAYDNGQILWEYEYTGVEVV